MSSSIPCSFFCCYLKKKDVRRRGLDGKKIKPQQQEHPLSQTPTHTYQPLPPKCKISIFCALPKQKPLTTTPTLMFVNFPYLTSQSLSFHSHTLFYNQSAVVYQPVQEISSDDLFFESFHLLRPRNALVRYLVWPTVTSTNASRSVFMCRAFLLVFSFFVFVDILECVSYPVGHRETHPEPLSY